jgi:hypothetical protein
MWHDGSYKTLGPIIEVKTKAFHPNVTFQPLPLNYYKESSELIPIPNIYSKGVFVIDFVETIATERRKMRRLCLWPNAGGINGTSAIKVPQSNFLDWFNSGWHHILQY